MIHLGVGLWVMGDGWWVVMNSRWWVLNVGCWWIVRW